jgi:hypothetical protein
MNIQLTQDEKLLVVRAHRLRQVVTADGFQDVKSMMREIEDEALDNLAEYDGDDDHKTACLAMQWKTVKAGNQKLLGRISERIKAGENFALSLVPAELQGKQDSPDAFAGVRPQCDVDEETAAAATETADEATPKPPTS